MPQLAHVHRHHHARFASAGQHEPGILIAALARAELLLPLRIPLVHGVHLPLKLRDSIFTQRLDFRRNDVAEALLVADVALALHREAGKPVAGNLRQQDARNTLHRKGKAGVFQHGFMPHRQNPADELALVVTADALLQAVHRRTGVAQPSAERHDLLRRKRMANQGNFHG